MEEKITIKNFGGLDEVTIPLNAINIFIGKQASGKSVSAKLIFFFKNIFNFILMKALDHVAEDEVIDELIEKFESYFPSEIWKDEEFEIVYELGNDHIKITKTLNRGPHIKFSQQFAQLLFGWSPNFEDVIETKRWFYQSLKKVFGENVANEQVFIPAGRSFFATFHNSIYSFLNAPIDPFLIEFGKFYQRTRNPMFWERGGDSGSRIENLMSEILVGRYKREGDKDYIIHKDKRKVEISFASSGQQEILPLCLSLARFNVIVRPLDLSGTTIYIEEPEAHLFPSAQKRIVEFIATVYNNSRSNLQFVITTHSPYILSAFNNLLYAGLLKEQGKDAKDIDKIVSKFSAIKPNELNAFEMRDGKLVDLIDRDLGLITATTLDKASEDIAQEFDALLELE